MASTDPQMKIRLPADLRERIRIYAESQNRSMNMEIVLALEKAFPKPVDEREILLAFSDALTTIRKSRELPAGAADEAIKNFARELEKVMERGMELTDPYVLAKYPGLGPEEQERLNNGWADLLDDLILERDRLRALESKEKE